MGSIGPERTVLYSVRSPALFSSAVMVNILSGDLNSSGVADWFERSQETVALSLTLAGKLDWPFKFWAVQVFAANFVWTPETIEVGAQVQLLYPVQRTPAITSCR